MFALLALCLASDQPITVVNKCPTPIIVVVKTVAPEVAPARARTFQRAVNYGKFSGHDCPSCGREQLEQAGRGPGRGTHWHVCEGCSSRWYH